MRLRRLGLWQNAGRRGGDSVPESVQELRLITKENVDLDTPGPEEMKELVASLSLVERKLLRDPNFISEDEADLIMSDRSFNEPGPTISLDELLKENAMTRRRKRA